MNTTAKNSKASKSEPESSKLSILNKAFPFIHLIISLLFTVVGVALIVLAGGELWHGILPASELNGSGRVNAVLEALAILTVAVAALELAQTILEEEVLRKAHMSAPTRVRRFLSRFLVVLVVALSIETLVFVFRVSREKPEQLTYAACIGITAAVLLIAWGVFIRFNRSAEELEPEAMEEAKREDSKL